VTEYAEHPRSYASSLALVAVLAVGFAVDALLGGAGAHVWGWLAALVLVVGTDLLVVYAARSTRTIRLTGEALTVGEDSVPRTDIAGLDDVEAGHRVLGVTLSRDLPRGTPGLGLRLADGSRVVVPTRRPERLAAALGVGAVEDAVRPATDADLALLAEIDERAETVFHVAGYNLPAVSLPERPVVAVLVIGSPPYGFAQLGEADGNAHLDEVAVLPGRMRQGVGTRLVEAACAWARSHGYRAMTLTTYADVPWNAPFYERLGFVPVQDYGVDVRERRRAESAAGLDAVGPRVAMRRDLDAGDAA
jgi:GNAT superfamily N-acetyltransferase